MRLPWSREPGPVPAAQPPKPGAASEEECWPETGSAGDGETGWVYGARDADGIELYWGKHSGPMAQKRVDDHRRRDAEFMRHATHVEIDRVPLDGILDTERIRIEKANDGDGTVFNRQHNADGWADRYYDGHSTRWDPDEVPRPDAAAARRARAANHAGYVGRHAQQRRNQSRCGE